MNKGDKLNLGENLLRRVYRTDKRYIDRKTGRPTSRAFVPRPKDDGKLSVDIERLTTYEKAIDDSERFVLFSFFSDLAFKLGLNCIYDPVKNINLAHAIITGFPNDDESIPGILARSSVKYGQ